MHIKPELNWIHQYVDTDIWSSFLNQDQTNIRFKCQNGASKKKGVVGCIGFITQHETGTGSSIKIRIILWYLPYSNEWKSNTDTNRKCYILLLASRILLYKHWHSELTCLSSGLLCRLPWDLCQVTSKDLTMLIIPEVTRSLSVPAEVIFLFIHLFIYFKL